MAMTSRRQYPVIRPMQFAWVVCLVLAAGDRAVGGGTAYFGASMLPWECSYLCAVDAETGKPEGDGRYLRKLEGELTLEGPMLASAGQLVVPQGRIPPLLFRRGDGQPRGTLEGGGGCFVLITKDNQILHGPGNKTGWITQSNMQTRAKIASFANANAMVVADDTDPKRVGTIRENLRQAQCYGSRVAVHHVSSFDELPLVGEFANLVVSERLLTEGAIPSTSAELRRVLRPAGGIAYLGQPAGAAPSVSEADLNAWLSETEFKGAKAVSDERGTWATVVRGALPGAGQWSHQYGSADNTAFGGETLQGSTATNDLLVQWIGRPGPRAQPDRSGRKPSPLSINGRLFVQGLHRLIGVDSYNGTILWAHEIPNLERFNIPRDCSNWCADDDYVYLAVDGKCWQIDAQTGDMVRQRSVIDGTDPKQKHQWGYVGRTKMAGRMARAIMVRRCRDPQSSAASYMSGRGCSTWQPARSSIFKCKEAPAARTRRLAKGSFTAAAMSRFGIAKLEALRIGVACDPAVG